MQDHTIEGRLASLGSAEARAHGNRRLATKRLWAAARTGGVLITIFFVTFPLVWLILTAFKTHRDALSTRLLFSPTLENFQLLFGKTFDFGPMIVNSVIISIVTVVGAVPLAAMAAYALSRYTFRGRNQLLIALLASQFLPGVVIIFPYYIMFRNLGLLDTRLGLIVLHLASSIPFCTWLLLGFIDSLPPEIEEAGLVDGCNEMRVLRYVTAPLLMPGIITAAVFAFVGSWNEFLFAYILTSDKARPMMVGLMGLINLYGVPWERLAAAGVLVLIPVFILSLSIRRYFIEGLTMGAVK
ncbi:MAG TPA: carbohydrate ABC transporter permease [Anaerolineae bacterium]